jgi:uncharacterized protein (DUF2062 family)
MNSVPSADPRKKQKPSCLWSKCRRSARIYYLRLRRLKGEPHEIAGGLAIGVFIALTPTIPLQTILAVSLAFVFRVSKLAAFLALWVNNPVSMAFIYFLDYQIGGLFVGTAGPQILNAGFSISHLVNLGWGFAFPLLIGGAVTGLGSAVLAYFVFRYLYTLLQRKRSRRLRGAHAELASPTE